MQGEEAVHEGVGVLPQRIRRCPLVLRLLPEEHQRRPRRQGRSVATLPSPPVPRVAGHGGARRLGNELYRSGSFAEALALYDRAIAISPGNTACRSNRAMALTEVGRLGEAVRECLEAVKLDPAYARVHKRLASLYLRFGQVENLRRHLCLSGIQEDQSEEQKLLLLEKHLNRCADARKFGDWKRALRESEAAIIVGADFSPQLFGVFKMQLNKVVEKAGGGCGVRVRLMMCASRRVLVALLMGMLRRSLVMLFPRGIRVMI